MKKPRAPRCVYILTILARARISAFSLLFNRAPRVQRVCVSPVRFCAPFAPFAPHAHELFICCSLSLSPSLGFLWGKSGFLRSPVTAGTADFIPAGCSVTCEVGMLVREGEMRDQRGAHGDGGFCLLIVEKKFPFGNVKNQNTLLLEYGHIKLYFQ